MIIPMPHIFNKITFGFDSETAIVTMGLKILVAIAITLVATASGIPHDDLRDNFEFRSTNLDEPAYRLKDNIQPTYEYVDMDVYLEENRIDGSVEIAIDVLEDDLQQIVLHQNLVSINSVTVLDSNNSVVSLLVTNPFELDGYYEILTINLAQPISIGSYTLLISYLGLINENPYDRGLYKGYYFLNGERRSYATTQFQPYHARKAFPCFDEPQFKNRFVISITRSPLLSQSYSNMAINETSTLPNGRIKETFLPTPVVSAYLVAFHISDFVETGLTSTGAKPFGIISRPGVNDQHVYAANVGLEITNWLDEYLDFPYYEMGQGVAMKNDHIALPDFPSGAMENWGMVNYREAYLLYDEQNTNINNQIFIATIMAHELAHKWFGNLVTCFWWSNLWLNESFASFFEYFATHGAEPRFELDEQFVIDYVHSALAADASSAVTPMNWTGVVTTPTITAHFSTSSYAKGASVLRMMEHFVRPTTFRNALRYYLSDNAYGLGTPNAMYAAFRQAVAEDGTLNQFSGVDVGEVFDSWVQNPGAPVVSVSINYETGEITATQERFQLSGTIPNTLWHIPLSYTRANNINFQDTTPTFILSTRSAVFSKPAGEEWVVFNIAQSGYYRVDYDDRSWDLISDALHNNHEQIHYLNRAQIVNDVLYFMRAGRMEIDRAFSILSFLHHETNYYVWAGALGQLDWLRRRLEHLPAVSAELDAWLLESMETVIQHLGFEESPTDSTSTIMNRMQIMNYACNMGHEGCVSDSLSKWNSFKNNPSQLVPVNLRRYVYCTGIRNGDRSDYDFLWNLYRTSENTADMVIMLRTLACSKDQTLIDDYLVQSISNDLIRAHDRTNAFSYSLQGNPENLQTVLNFVYNRYADIRENYGGSARLIVAMNALTTYLTDFQDVTSFQTWLYSNQLNFIGNEFATGVGVVSGSISNLEWGNRAAVDVVTFLRGRTSGATSVLASLSLITTTVMAILVR